MKKRIKFDKGMLLLILILVIAVVSSIFLYLQISTDKMAETLKSEEPVKLLFTLGDKETLIFSEVFFYDPVTHKGAVFDIPGETGVKYESLTTYDRIDISYRDNKIQDLKKKIEELIGESIPYYIHLEVSDIPNLVDLFDGMEIFVANPVEIIDPVNMILLPSGNLVLDGSKAAIFAVYKEEGEANIERITRRQKFFHTLLAELGAHSDYLTGADVFPYLKNTVNSNLSSRALETFLLEMKTLDIEHIVSLRVLGVNRIVNDKELLFPHYDGRLLKETVIQTFESLANSSIISDEELNITIEILNGTDKNGLASRTAQVFSSFGYTIENIGNADSQDYENTVVIDRTGDTAIAERVADIINCIHIETQTVSFEDNSGSGTGLIDVSIILGKDFDGRYCKN